MRIAIAAELFDDQQRMGSHRPRALAREWVRQGHQVTVFTVGTDEDPTPPPDGVQVVRLGSAARETPTPRPLHKMIRKGRIAWAIAPTVLPLLPIRRRIRNRTASEADHQLLRELQVKRKSAILTIDAQTSLKALMKRSRPGLQEMAQSNREVFDLVFSTSEELGGFLSECGLAPLWVQDFRDATSTTAGLPSTTRQLLRRQRRLLRDADAVTAVSRGVKRSLENTPGLGAAAGSISVFTNGFTARTQGRTASAEPSETLAARTLNVVYTGQIYSHRESEMARFLEVIRSANETLGENAVALHYAGNTSGVLERLADRTRTQESVVSHGSLDHSAALELQNQADVLLVLSWNTRHDQGILSGKFLEYLGANKPIVAMVGGDMPNSEVGVLIEELNVGICCEQARGAADLENLQSWLVKAAHAKLAGDPVPFDPVEGGTLRFEYGQIARQLAAFFSDLPDAPANPR